MNRITRDKKRLPIYCEHIGLRALMQTDAFVVTDGDQLCTIGAVSKREDLFLVALERVDALA